MTIGALDLGEVTAEIDYRFYKPCICIFQVASHTPGCAWLTIKQAESVRDWLNRAIAELKNER